MKKRLRIPPPIQADILTRSRRRCCLCTGLNRDIGVKRGQLAHINGDPNDNRPDNLAFLCLPHHDEYDGRFKQSKSITIKELTSYRDELYEYVRENLALGEVHTSDSILMAEGDPLLYDSILMTDGDPLFYVEEFASATNEFVQTLNDLSSILVQFAAELKRNRAHLQSIPLTNKRENKRYFDGRGERMNDYSKKFVEVKNRLAVAAERTLSTFNKAVVLLSDDESASHSQFLRFHAGVVDLKTFLENNEREAAKTSILVRAMPRGTSAYNKGRRKLTGALGDLAKTNRKAQEMCTETLIVLNDLSELV